MTQFVATPRETPFCWPEARRMAVSLTFDDARLSQIDRGMEILEAHGVRATFYVSPRHLEDRLESWRAAVAHGHEIGNHTMTHPCSGNFAFARANALEDYTLQRMDEELDQANRAIETALGVRPRTFAYPCGQTFVGRGENVQSYVPLVARRFLAGRLALNEGPNDPTFCDLAQLAAMTSDGKRLHDLTALIDQAAAAGAWLVLCGHEVGDAGPQTTRADVLEALCRYCKDPANGFWIDTVAAIAAHIEHARNP